MESITILEMYIFSYRIANWIFYQCRKCYNDTTLD